MTQTSAPGKAILFGEHAVVYDQPALAVPLSDLRTSVNLQVSTEAEAASIRIVASDIDQSYWLYERDNTDPIVYAINLTLKQINVNVTEPLELFIRSDIPIASGLGSGAAASVAIIRTLANHFEVELEDQVVSEIAFTVEKLHHGTPSGIDNSVITFEQPLYYKRDQELRPFSLGQPLLLVLGHCGISSQTVAVVGEVRDRWKANPKKYSDLFMQIGSLVERAYQALIAGNIDQVGILMDDNHSLLQRMGVSIDELDRLVDCARSAGAYGAKLSGGGAGGFMIALVDSEKKNKVAHALQDAGAHHTLTAQVEG
jgi:mevalonate kinase